MVEFALVATVIFFPLVFGFIELGRQVFAKSTITAAAREGVRFAIVRGADSPSPADSAAVANHVIGRTPLSPIIVLPTWEDPSKEYGTYAQVQVRYNYVPLVRLLPSRTITSTSRQVIVF